MFETEAAHLAIGQRNSARNGFTAHFEIAATGLDGCAVGSELSSARRGSFVLERRRHFQAGGA